MGQYSGWLHYREVEQLLQAQLEPLTAKLAQLQAHAQELRENPADKCTDNPIIAALELCLHSRPAAAQPENQVNRPTGPAAQQQNGTDPATGVVPAAASANGRPETMSPALFAWSNLPNLGLQDGPLAAVLADQAAPASQAHRPLPPLSHADGVLLPEDMLTFFDQHALTDPQIELPHWLRPIAYAASTKHSDTPVDQESIRTNRLVQRWIERWGRQPSAQRPEGRNQS